MVQFDTDLVSPIKIVKINDFYGNSEELLWNKSLNNTDSNLQKENQSVAFFLNVNDYRKNFQNSKIESLKNILNLNK